ncbi:hypothetical protein ACFX1R_015449 [Malus domestica]
MNREEIDWVGVLHTLLEGDKEEHNGNSLSWGKRSEREVGDNCNRHEPKRRSVLYSYMNSTMAEADEYQLRQHQ